MKKEMKNILPGAALAALLAAVIVYCIMLNVEKNVMSDYEKGMVVTAADDMVKGIVITPENAEKYLVVKEMDKGLIPEAAFSKIDEMYGQITAQNIDRGALVTRSMMTDPDQMMENMKDPVVAGFKADDLYQVVSGILRSGDRIHICTVNKETGEAALVWNDIFVKEVFDGSGVSVSAEDKVTAAQRVNIILEKENIEKFYSELSSGTLRVVKAVE